MHIIFFITLKVYDRVSKSINIGEIGETFATFIYIIHIFFIFIYFE